MITPGSGLVVGRWRSRVFANDGHPIGSGFDQSYRNPFAARLQDQLLDSVFITQRLLGSRQGEPGDRDRIDLRQADSPVRPHGDGGPAGGAVDVPELDIAERRGKKDLWFFVLADDLLNVNSKHIAGTDDVFVERPLLE